MDAKLIARFVLRESLGLVVLGVALFWSAGRTDWWPAWACLSLTAAWIAATLVVILRTNPSLLAERLGPRKGAKTWDVAILGALGVTQLARYVVAGLEQRHAWTSGFPPSAQAIALVLCAAGFALVVWATGSNAFFSQVVRIQHEHQHGVARGGPYRWVRHPAYVGMILFELAAPVMLDSRWALLPSVLGALLFVLRTALEDRTLRAELPGYGDYAREVGARLVPGSW